jgi:hypothetical protein
MIDDHPGDPEADVTFSQRDGTLGTGVGLCRIFSDPKQVEECYHNKVGHRRMPTGEVVARRNGGDGRHRDGEFRLRRWVLVVIALQDPCNGQIKGVLGRGSTTGVGMSVQNVLLGNTAECDSN